MMEAIDKIQNIRPKKSTVVYWIRHKDHTDITNDGYVGITSQKLSYRINNHFTLISKNKSPCLILQSAVLKYGIDSLKIDVICIANEQYCLDLEYKLRPKQGIGWNSGVGGRATLLGVKRSEETKLKINAHKVGVPRKPETRHKLSVSLTGNKCAFGSIRTEESKKLASIRARKHKHTDEAKRKIGEAVRLRRSKICPIQPE